MGSAGEKEGGFSVSGGGYLGKGPRVREGGGLQQGVENDAAGAW